MESKQKALELQTTSEEEKEDWMKVSRRVMGVPIDKENDVFL